METDYKYESGAAAARECVEAAGGGLGPVGGAAGGIEPEYYGCEFLDRIPPP